MSIKPKSIDLYNAIWSQEHDSETWGDGRDKKLFSLIGDMNVGGKNILDVCSGRATKAYCALEYGAKVAVLDGSEAGPNFLMSKVIEGVIKKTLPKETLQNCTIFPGVHVDHITSLFDENQFDIVYMGWALHHLDEPEKALEDMLTLTKKNGLLAVSFFPEGTTSQIQKDVRAIFLKSSLEDVLTIGEILGKVAGHNKVISLEDLTESGAYILLMDEVIKLAKDKKYTFQEIEDNFHIEDMQTPHLKNLSQKWVHDIISKKAEIVYESSGIIRALKQ